MTIERISIENRDQWLALRKQDVTASDVAAICGEDLFDRTVLSVWAEKTGRVDPQAMTDAMKRGVWGEPAVFAALEWEHPDWEIRRAKVYLRDPAVRIGATPDGVAVVPGKPGIVVVQCKVVSEHAFRDKWLADATSDPHDLNAEASAPLGYQLQTITESMLAGAECGVLAALIVGTWKWTLRLFWVDRNPEAEDVIRQKVAGFWNDVAAGRQPAVDPARDAGVIKRLYPTDDGNMIDLSSDNEIPLLVEQRAAAAAVIKEHEAVKETAETAIKAKLGEAQGARIADGRKITWKTQQRAEYTVAASSFRVLRVGK